MKRLLLVCVLAFVAVPSVASAETVPCRDKVVNDWEHDGKVPSTFPVACYRDALAHMRGGDTIYTSMQQDIQSAMQAAIERSHGKKVPKLIGKGFTPTQLVTDHSGGGPKAASSQTSTNASEPVESTSSSSGLPVPLIVLGGLALVLVAAGGLGMIARRRGSPAE